jgi:integrase
MSSIHPTKRDPSTGKAARDTRWKVRFRDANGRSRAKTFDRKVDAERFAERNGADLQRGDWIDPRSASISFDRLADTWWATTVKLAPMTRRGYWKLLKNHVLPAFSGRPQGSITWVDVEQFISDKIAEGNDPKRVRDMVSIISLIMKIGMRGRMRTDNPAADHVIPRRKRKIDQGDVLTMEQAHELVIHTRDPYKPLVWLFVMAGLRPSELCGLRVRSINFTKRLLHVSETLTYVHGFEDVPVQHSWGPPKTQAGDRFVPLPTSLCEDLAEMLAVRAENRGSKIEPDETLFESIKGGKPLDAPAIRRYILRPALVAAGLPESFRTYDLRHTHASLLIDDGANPLEVAHRLGHTDPTVTLRVYGHLFEGAQERLTDKLEERRKAAGSAKRQEREVVNLDQRRRAVGDAEQNTSRAARPTRKRRDR